MPPAVAAALDDADVLGGGGEASPSPADGSDGGGEALPPRHWLRIGAVLPVHPWTESRDEPPAVRDAASDCGVPSEVWLLEVESSGWFLLLGLGRRATAAPPRHLGGGRRSTDHLA